MIYDDFYPIIIIPTIKKENGIIFLHRDNKIEIESNEVDLIWGVLSQCNGYLSVSDIINMNTSYSDKIKKIVNELVNIEAIVDSRKQYLHFHKISSFPTGFTREMSLKETLLYTSSQRLPIKVGQCFSFNKISSSLDPILLRRRSCRNFSNRKLNINLVGNICRYGYSIKDHHVPSGGALYPIKIYILINEDQNDISAGYYEYDSEQNLLISFCKTVDVEQLKHCFNSEDLAFGSKVQIIIAADLNRQTYKYSNRGYRLTLLEAGHVAENMCLFCAEQGISTCELGGLLDEPLRKELELDNEIFPLIAVAIGYPSNNPDKKFDECGFLEKYSYIFDNYSTKATSFDSNCSFFGATTRYGEKDSDIAGATSASYSHAIFKSNIEAYERKVSGDIRVDYFGTANELDNLNLKWINPDILNPLTMVQKKESGLVSFFKDLPLQWTKGILCKTGDIVYVPSDLIYYGHVHNKNTIYYANSSGIAAHIDRNMARKNALTEIVERDAIMRCWFSQKAPTILAINILPIHVQKRIKYWERLQRIVYVMDMPSEYGKVILVAIVSNQYPAFVCGAAATIDYSKQDFFKTVNEALQEAEYCLYSYLKYPNYKEISFSNVKTPNDHGRFYHSPKNANLLKWLWSGNICNELSVWQTQNYNELIKKIDSIEVTLSQKGAPIYVERVLSPKLVPISFGCNNMHYTHLALNGDFNPDSLKVPHFFA